MKPDHFKDYDSEEIYQLILNNINELIGILEPDHDFKFIFINENVYKKILQFTNEDLIGKSFLKIVHREYRNDIIKILKQKKSISNFPTEIIIIDKTNKEKWFEININPYLNSSNEKKILINLKSISKQKNLEKILDESKDSLKVITKKIPEIKFWKLFSPERFEEALYNSYEMLQIVIENIPEYIFWKDRNLNYLGCNDHYAKLIGVEFPENIIGKQDKDLISNKNKLLKLNEHERLVIQSGNIQSNEFTTWKINGKDSLLKINRIPLYDSEKNPVGLLVSYDDITEIKEKEYELRRERDILERIMETSPVGIIILNKKGIITFINSRAEKIFNVNKRDILQKKVNDPAWKITDFNGNIITEEELLFYKIDKIKTPIFDIHYMIESLRGEKLMLSINSAPLFNDTGEFNGIIATVENVTDKQKAKQELMESEQKFRTISEHSLVGICIIQNGKIKYINSQLANIFGFEPEELKDWDEYEYLKLIHPDDKDFVTEKMNKSQLGEQIDNHFQFRIIKESGKIIWLDNFSTTINYKGEKANLSTIIDITRKKIAEIKLKESGEKYRNLFENSPNMIALLDSNGLFLTANNKLLSFFKIEEEFLIGKNFKSFENLIPYNFNELTKEFENVLKYDFFEPTDIKVIIKKNKTIWISIQANLTKIDGENLVQVIMRDIDDFKKSEKIVQLNKLRLETLAILNQMRDVSERELGEFAINKAVELTNSYGAILVIPSMNKNMFYFSDNLQMIHSNKLKFNKCEKKFLINLLNIKELTIKNNIYDSISLFEKDHLKNFKINRYITIPIKEGNRIVASTCVINKDLEYSDLDINQLTLLMDGVWKIFQRKRAEKALKISEKRYRSLLNSSSVGILEIHLKDDDITYINPSLLNMLGYRKEQINKEFMLKIIHPEDINQIFNSSEEKELEFRIYDETGKTKWLAGKRTNQFDEIGDLISFRLWLDDVTEKKIYERLITELNINFLNFTADIQGNIQLLLTTCVNFLDGTLAVHIHKFEEEKKFKILTNDNRTFYYYDFEKYDRDLFVFEFFKGEHDFPQTILDIDQTRYAKTDPLLLNYNIKGGYGKLIKSRNEFNDAICVFFNHNPVISHEHQLILFLISDAIAIEQSRWKVKQNLEDQNKMLNEMNKLKVELFSRTSHELKTPLISIKGFTELLLKLHKSKLDSDMISIVEEIMDGAKRLEKIINMLLQSSKLDQNLLILNKKLDDLVFLIRFCVNELQSLANLRNQKINLNIHDKLIIKFDKERMYEVISNLLVNAIKYTPPNGEIDINSEIRDNSFVISITDTGVGLTENEMEQLFKQFGKIERYGHGWDLGIEGTGLGLYISKKIIDLHGGNIWATSKGRNKGSTFSFSLPFSS